MLLSVIRLVWSWKDFLNKKALTTLRPLPQLQRWTMFDLFSLLLPASDGRSTIWMLRAPSYVVTCLKRFTWKTPLILWQIPILFVDCKSWCMVWNRPIEINMLTLTISLLILGSTIVNLITFFMYYMFMVIPWLLLSMFMI